MKTGTVHRLQFGERRLDYRVVRSTAAKKLRIRVRPDGVEVVQPSARSGEDVSAFLERNKRWIFDQVRRMERFRHIRKPEPRKSGTIPYRGTDTRVRLQSTRSRASANFVRFADGEIVVSCSPSSRTSAARSLETWLRKQARAEISRQLGSVTTRLRQTPRRVYVMGQRTKWGNCSSARNLSLNWRLILAPEFVMRYIVTHEAVHLAIPDHSAKFWLTVQSLCRETGRAKQWLSANGRRLIVSDLLSRVFA